MKLISLAFLLAFLLALCGCGGDGGGISAPTPPPPSVSPDWSVKDVGFIDLPANGAVEGNSTLTLNYFISKENSTLLPPYPTARVVVKNNSAQVYDESIFSYTPNTSIRKTFDLSTFNLKYDKNFLDVTVSVNSEPLETLNGNNSFNFIKTIIPQVYGDYTAVNSESDSVHVISVSENSGNTIITITGTWPSGLSINGTATVSLDGEFTYVVTYSDRKYTILGTISPLRVIQYNVKENRRSGSVFITTVKNWTGQPGTGG